MRRIVTDIRKIKIAGKQTELMSLRIGRNVLVFRVPKADITNIEGVMTCLPQVLASGPRQVGINEKSHGMSLGGWQRVVVFLFDQLVRIGQGGPHVFCRHPVLVSNLFYAHPAGQSSNEPHNRDPRTLDDRLAMLHVWINDNALSHLLRSLQGIFLHRTKEMQQSQPDNEDSRFSWLSTAPIFPTGQVKTGNLPGYSRNDKVSGPHGYSGSPRPGISARLPAQDRRTRTTRHEYPDFWSQKVCRYAQSPAFFQGASDSFSVCRSGR